MAGATGRITRKAAAPSHLPRNFQKTECKLPGKRKGVGEMARRTLTPSRGPSGRGATKAIRTQDMSVEGAADGPLMRALGVIEYVATSCRPLTVAEIAEGLSLPRTTAHRLVGGLE